MATFTWHAAEYNFNVEKRDASESPFRIHYDIELLSWPQNNLAERVIKTNRRLKLQAKQ